jgi:hypothetical protein
LAIYFAATDVAILVTAQVQSLSGIKMENTQSEYRSPEFARGRHLINALGKLEKPVIPA